MVGTASFWLCLRNNDTKQKSPKPASVLSSRLPSGPPGARTLDTLIKSQVLYQLS